MLSEGIASARGRYAAYLHRDRVNGVVRARRGSRLAAITSGGAIPEKSLYTVVAHPEGTIVGTAGEDFAVERSEEHTSELQSRLQLLCRLLLVKKKNKGLLVVLT